MASFPRCNCSPILCRCLQCHSNCSSCFGGGDNQCLTCANGFYFFNNSCVKQCPFGMFVDKTGRCQVCSLSCEGCGGEATNCTKCKGEDLVFFAFLSEERLAYIRCYFFSDGLNKVNGVCKPLCQDGTFHNSTLAAQTTGNKTKDHCSKCHESCSTCFGATKYNCLRCRGVKFRDPHSKLCSLDCPQNGYYYGFNSTLCERCPSECAQCINLSTCSRCVPGLFLHEKKCIPHCPQGFYARNATKTCTPCDKACVTCAGSSTSCTKCAPSKILFKNQCVDKCPSGMFLSKEFNRCLPCDDSCSTCVGAGRSRCTSCKAELVLFQAQCRSTCPSRYYHHSESHSCQPCDYYCKRCSPGEL